MLGEENGELKEEADIMSKVKAAVILMMTERLRTVTPQQGGKQIPGTTSLSRRAQSEGQLRDCRPQGSWVGDGGQKLIFKKFKMLI